jgi:hypothetical protein
MKRASNTSPERNPMSANLPSEGLGPDDGIDDRSGEVEMTTSDRAGDERDEPLQKRKKLEYSDETTTRQGRDLFSSGDEEDRKPAGVGATNAHMSTLLISSIVPLSQADEPQYTHKTAFDRRFEGETEVCEQVSQET